MEDEVGDPDGGVAGDAFESEVKFIDPDFGKRDHEEEDSGGKPVGTEEDPSAPDKEKAKESANEGEA